MILISVYTKIKSVLTSIIDSFPSIKLSLELKLKTYFESSRRVLQVKLEKRIFKKSYQQMEENFLGTSDQVMNRMNE
jgi:hypothetical protein